MDGSRRRFGVAAATLALATVPGRAQDRAAWPNRAVKLMVPTPPGGPLDVTARMLAERLAPAWGQSVVVENRSGGNGAIAYAAVAAAPADGYTVALTLSSLLQNVLIARSPGYALSGIEPIGILAMMPNAFAVSADVPARSVDEFVSWARSRPKGVDFGSSGPGSSGHIMGAMFARDARLSMVHVPFRGDVPGIQALLAGEIATLFGTPGNLAQHARAGKIRLLAVAAPRRLADLPDVPTFAEAGYPNVNLSGWSMAVVPAGTPRAVVERLSADIGRLVRSPEIAARIAGYGFEPVGSPPDAARTLLTDDAPRWKAAIDAAGLATE